MRMVRPRVHGVLSMIDELTPMAALQLAQPRAVAGMRAASDLHDLDGVDQIALDVLVPPNVWLRGPTVHRATDLVVPEIVVVNGIRCTDAVRTLCDLGRVVDDAHVERAVESLLRRQPAALRLLEERATQLARPGKAGPQSLLRVLRARPDTPTESDLETVYWQCLREHGVELPVRQYKVGRYQLDLAYAMRRSSSSSTGTRVTAAGRRSSATAIGARQTEAEVRRRRAQLLV